MLKLIFSIHCKTHLIAKEFIYRTLTSARYKESFQYRILDYFENVLKTAKTTQQQYKMTMQTENLFLLNDPASRQEIDSNKEEKLQSIYEGIQKLKNLNDEQIFEEKVKELDLECFLIINALNMTEILCLLNAFLKVAPNNLVMSYFYDKAITILLQGTESGFLTNNEIVQLLFFISLRKEKSASYINYLLPYLPDMDELPLLEKCITAKSFYRSSVQLPIRQSKILEKVLENDFEQLIKDSNLLVSLCKAIIISNPSNSLTLKNLSKALVELEVPLDFKTMAHILRLYAEALLLEPKAIDWLVKKCIELIQKDSVDQTSKLRLKDVDTFLWSISYLGLTLSLNEKLVLRTYVEQRFNEYKIIKNLNILVNTILCLHLLRCWSTKVVKKCLQERLFYSIFHEHNNWKIRSRLQLLITQITLEMKMIVPCSLMRRFKIGYTPSENMKIVANIGSSLTNRGIVNMSVLECPIETLVIPGVTLVTNKDKYHVDVLDNTTCLKNTNIPHGLTNLKLRLLSRLRYRQILINGDIFKEDPEKAQSLIERQIINRINYGQASSLFKEESRTGSIIV